MIKDPILSVEEEEEKKNIWAGGKMNYNYRAKTKLN